MPFLRPLLLSWLCAHGLAFPFSGRSMSSGDNGSPAMSVAQSISEPPAGWVKDDQATIDKDASMMTLRIYLKQQNMDKFHDLAMKIATPGHELYGSHLSQHVIDSMIAPKQEAQDLVLQWLYDQGLGQDAHVSPRLDSIVVESSVAQIESLLDAKYSAFVKPATGESALRTLAYSLPDEVRQYIGLVQPTTFFGLQTMRSTISDVFPITGDLFETEAISAVTGCSGSTITPTCLANLYSFTTATAYTSGRMGIAGFLGQHPIPADLTTFLNSYAVENNKGQTYSCVTINGGTCPTTGTPGIEANLDVQYARAITEKIPNVYYSTGGSPPISGSGTNNNEPYLEFLNYLLALDSTALPNTLSISYGDDTTTVPLDYADTTCNLFAQLGARGVSILVASGDSGVGTTCTLNGKKAFTTSYPAECPWVTTVGGTTGNSPENAWVSGGAGFSNRFGRPSYQNTAVSNWLATDTTHASVSSYFNSSGRAYPDIAAQATNFVIVASGKSEGVSGTSCATPTFASVVQLLNSDRVSSGKAPLGFLNPWLYSTATSGLTDITSGKVSGCSGVISGAGFSAVKGWDPATGWGTPNFTKLLPISRAT